MTADHVNTLKDSVHRRDLLATNKCQPKCAFWGFLLLFFWLLQLRSVDFHEQTAKMPEPAAVLFELLNMVGVGVMWNACFQMQGMVRNKPVTGSSTACVP